MTQVCMTTSSLVILCLKYVTKLSPEENGLGKFTTLSAYKGRITFEYLFILVTAIQKLPGTAELLFQIVDYPLEI